MKKVLCGVVVVFLLAGGALLQAQEKKVSFSLNVGAQTNIFEGSSFERAFFSLDARAGIRLARSFEVSPEIMGVVNDKFEGGYILYPGVMLNYTPGNFFVGIGAVIPIAHADGETSSGNPAPRINIGYRAGHLIFTAFFLTYTESGLDFLDMNFAGATIGYAF